MRNNISWESSAGRRFSWNIIPYFCRKLGKMSQNLLSTAVVISALRVYPLSAITTAGDSSILILQKIRHHALIFLCESNKIWKCRLQQIKGGWNQLALRAVCVSVTGQWTKAKAVSFFSFINMFSRPHPYWEYQYFILMKLMVDRLY